MSTFSVFGRPVRKRRTVKKHVRRALTGWATGCKRALGLHDRWSWEARTGMTTGSYLAAQDVHIKNAAKDMPG